MSAPRWSRLLVALQLAALVVVGAATAARFHIFSPTDEKQHYDYVQSIAERHRLPLISELVSPQTQAIALNTWPRPAPANAVDLSGHAYEAFQPPLYYAVAAPAFAVAGDHRAKVEVVRFFDLALVLVGAGLLWVLARAVAPDRPRLAYAGALVVLLWPGVVVRAVTISPTSLELVAVTALLLALWRLRAGAGRRWAVAAGVLLGACLLTRSTLVYLAPLFVVVVGLAWRARRDHVAAALALVLPVLMLAPWLAFNHAHYGTPTATDQARAQQRPVVNPTDKRYAASDAVRYTRRLFDSVLATEQGGQLGVWWVRAAATVLAAALFGAWLILALTRRREAALWFFGVPVLLGYALMVYILLGANWPSFNLRYLYPALPALGLAVAGAVPSARRAWWGVAACTALAIALWIDMAGAFYFTQIGNRLGI